jgi:uracil-DNA glycosylase family 4
MCIAEAPGREEDRSAVPLIGQSGKILRSTLSEIYSKLGLDPHMVYLTNVVKCRPRVVDPDTNQPTWENRTPSQAEIDECIPWLQQEIDEVQPRVILLLGATARDAIGDLDVGDDVEFVSTWHPAYILRQKHKLDAWKADVESAVRLAFDMPLVEQPHPAGATWSIGQPDLHSPWLSADTEYDDLAQEGIAKTPVGWSLSDGDVTFYQPGIPNIILPHVYLHNAGADLVNLGIDPDDLSRYDDTMMMAYPLQQAYHWPFLGLKRDVSQGANGLAQILCHVEWKYSIHDLLREWVDTTNYHPGKVSLLKKGGWKWQVGKDSAKGYATEADAHADLECHLATHPEVIKHKGKWSKCVFSQAYETRPDECTEYAATDALGTARLARRLVELQDDQPWARDWYEHFEKPLIPCLVSMEAAGVRLDASALNAAGTVIDSVRADAETRLRESLGPTINLGSIQQMGPVLLDLGLVDGKLTETGLIATGEDHILAAFNVEKADDLPETPLGFIAKDVLEWREMGKLRSTYVTALLEGRDGDSRVHGRFKSGSTITSRLASSDPALQTIPAPGIHVSSAGDTGLAIRRAFVPRPGSVFVIGDGSQLQLRLFGEYTRDPIFLSVYGVDVPPCACELCDYGLKVECKCERCDLHQKFTNTIIAQGYNVKRTLVKNGVFGTLFGAADKKLADTLMIPVEHSGQFLAMMRREIPSLVTWPDVVSQELAGQGYIDTLQGWRMYLPDFFSPVYKWHAEAVRVAACGKIQGSEGGVIRDFMIRLYNWLRVAHPSSRMVLQVHDEVAVECPESEAGDIRVGMKQIFEECGRRWCKAVQLKMDPKIVTDWASAK